MATQVQNRRGTTAEHSTFTGAVGELTVDTDKDTAVVHDGSTAGGAPLLREDQSNLPTSAPSNGVYLPSANNVAISSNSSERIRIGANGEIGIGGANYGTSGQVLTSGGSGAAPSWTTLTVNTDKIEEGNSSAEVIDTGSDGRFVVTTEGSERLRIDSSGRLGLGTSSPGYLLTVNGRISYSGAIGEGADTTLSSASTEVRVAESSTWQSLSLYTAGSQRLKIDSSGRVGIGTTSPGGSQSALLHVVGAGACQFTIDGTNANGSYLTFENSGTAKYFIGSGAQLAGGTVSELALRSQAGGGITFLTNGANERARIDSSGRLLVGTSSSSAAGRLTLQGSSSSSTGQTYLRLNRGSANPTNGQPLGFITFGDSSDAEGASIIGVPDGDWATNDYPGRLVFSTTADGASSPTERMRIKETGHIKISNTGSYRSVAAQNNEIVNSVNANALELYCTNASFASTVLQISADRNTSNGTYNFIQASRIGTTDAFKVLDSGNVQNTNNSYGAISDARLKENIVDATSQWNDLKSLQVRKFNFKEETGNSTHTQIGLIAQEVELVSPGLVTESPDRDEEGNDLGTVTKSVNYSVLYMKAVKALQEVMERIETLEAKVAALEAQ